MEELIQKMEGHFELVILIFFAFAIGLAIIEFGVEVYKRKMNRWRLGEMWASFSVFLTDQLLEKGTSAIFAGGLFFLAQLIPWEIPINIWTTLLCIVLIDFIYYWEHRIEHRVRVLWSYHSIHHSSPIYNYTTALRVSFIDGLVTWVFFVPAILLGFHPYVVILSAILILTYQFWLHTELIGKLGWFEKIFVTPSQHRVHHGIDKPYLDKNFGGMFSIWDRLFGSYEDERQKPTYGITNQLNSINPITVHFREYAHIFRDMRKAKSWKEAWNYLIKPPGWKPAQKQS